MKSTSLIKEEQAILASLPPFKDYLFKNRRNRITLSIAAVAVVVQFTVFKYFYPFASFIHGDSFVYIGIAYQNLDVNAYLVGYGRFLRIFSVFSQSDIVLVAFQYIMLQVSALYLLFTLFHFYSPGKVVQNILLSFMIFNPLFLYMANLVSSDAFFLILSFIWLTLLLWIIHRPGIRLIIWHALVIFVAFTVRNNALIYPIISAVAFYMSRQSLRIKLAGFSAGVILIGLFILYTGNKFKELTGTWQYSPFSGWQIINNALYAYRYVDSADRKPVPARFYQLDKAVRTYFDTTRDHTKHPEEEAQASTVYMWDHHHSPLYRYRDLQFGADTTAAYEDKNWASIAPFYADYGINIIRKYPREFAAYFLWPNAIKYYSPPIEFLELYNSGKDTVTGIAKIWFGYKSTKVTTRLKDLRVRALDFYPILSGIMNVVFLLGFISFVLLNGFKQPSLFRKGLLLAGSIWVINAGFTIFVSSAALRFQAFPILLMCTFATLLLDYVYKAASQNQSSSILWPLNTK